MPPSGDRQGVKQLAVEVASPAFRQLLAELLQQWSYQVVPAAEEILTLRAGGREAVLELVPGGGEEPEALPLPSPVASLWLALERHFHSPPRQHLRISICHPVIVQAPCLTEPSVLVSLSDQGGRFRFSRELGVGEEAVVCLQAGGENFLLEGRIIYTIDRREIGGTGYENGIVFDRLPPGRRRWLHERLVCACLQRVRARLPEEVFREGLVYFEYPAELLTRADDFCLA